MTLVKGVLPTRVLHIVTIMNRAGLETMLMNYYRNIDREKVQFDFLVHRKQKGDYDDEIETLGGRIYHIQPVSLFRPRKYFKAALEFFNSHKVGYKIVHSHLDALSAFPLNAAKHSGVPIRIAHSHTNSFDKDIKYPVRMILKWFIRFYANYYAGCSVSAIRFMFGNVKEPIVINNAINIASYKFNETKRHKTRHQMGIGKNTRVFGHVGRFSYPKNHEYLITVFSRILNIIPDSYLLLVGDGNLRPTIEKMVDRIGISDHVLFAGIRSDVPDMMLAMDAFLMPSRYEGVPVVAVEAQSSGLPCLLSGTVTRDVAVTDKCLFIPIDYASIQEWADIAVDSCTGLRKSIDLRNSGYDVKQESKNLENYYEKLIKNSTKG